MTITPISRPPTPPPIPDHSMVTPQPQPLVLNLSASGQKAVEGTRAASAAAQFAFKATAIPFFPKKAPLNDVVEVPEEALPQYLDPAKWHQKKLLKSPEELYDFALFLAKARTAKRNRRAVFCLELSADKGSAKAMYLLGDLYSQGLWGLRQNDYSAAEWYAKSAARFQEMK